MPNKLLMIQSYMGRNQPVSFPIALASLAPYLQDRYELNGFDPNVYPNPEEELHLRLKSFNPDIIAVSLRNIDTTNIFDPHIYYKGFLATIKGIREINRDIPLIVGGAGFSLFAQRILIDNPQIDFGVYLEGEETFPELLENLNDPSKVKGIYCRDNGNIVFTGTRDLVSLEDAPLPKWDLFDVDRYRAYPFPFGIETKRGCAFHCVYCSYFVLHGKKIRCKRPERVVEEISELRRRHSVKHICFLDSVFNVPDEHAMAVLKLMKKEVSDVKWLGYVSEKGITAEFARLAMETGLRVFVFSLDAFTDKCLKLMGKDTTVKGVNQAIDILKNTPRAEIGFNFFVNGPGYTYGTLAALFWFLIKTKLKFRNRFRLLKVKFGYIRIEPGTPIYRSALQNGDIPADLDILPLTSKGYTQFFFLNKNLWLFNYIFISFKKVTRRIITALKKGLRTILPPPKHPDLP